MGWGVSESCNFLAHPAGLWQQKEVGQSTAVIVQSSSLGDVPGIGLVKVYFTIKGGHLLETIVLEEFPDPMFLFQCHDITGVL